MKLKDRIGIDLGSRIRLEDGVEWAGKNGVRFIDIRLDTAENALPRFNDERGAVIRAACEKYGLKLGLHTNSAVNIAEYSPYVDDAVDRYLEGYIDVYGKLGANWIVVHAGYHFTKDRTARMQAGLERIKRAVAKAEKAGAILYLENLNKEPDNAEVHYLAHTVEEYRYYFERIDSPNFRLSFTPITRIWCRMAAMGSSMRWIFARSAKFALPIVSATASKSISIRARAISTSARCSSASRPLDSRGITRTHSARSMTC